MSRQWETKTLAELVGDRGITYGIVQPGSEFEGGVPLIRAGDISGGKVETTELKRVDPEIEAKYRRSRLRGGEMLLTLVGNVGESATATPEMVGFNVARAVGVFPIKDDPGSKWVEYSLRSPDIQHLIATWCNTTVQHTLNLKEAAEIPIPVPPQAVRDRVIEILGSLDDKIEANWEMNRTLEAMAQALYREWFVDFGPFQDGEFMDSKLGEIPEGWEPRALDSTANFLNGVAWSKYKVRGEEPSLPVLKIRELQNGTSAGSNRVGPRLPDKYVITAGDIIFSWSGTLVLKRWDGENVALNQHLFKVTPTGVPDWFSYYAIDQHMKEFRRVAANKATTMGHINRRHLSEAKVAVPPEELMSALDRKMKPIFEQIQANATENIALAETRDYLLPKLLSGEIDVGKASELASS